MFRLRSPSPPSGQDRVRFPLLGPFLRDIEANGAESLGWFIAALVGSVALLGLIFGLPGVVFGMLALAAIGFCAIVFVSNG